MATDTRFIELGDCTSSAVTWTPDAGEVWYIEAVQFFCDGSGNGDTHYTKHGIFPTGVSPGYIQYGIAGSRTSSSNDTFDSSNKGFAERTIGKYLTDSTEIYAKMRDGYTGGANWTAYIEVRRVI